jgi:hypothetical protein
VISGSGLGIVQGGQRCEVERSIKEVFVDFEDFCTIERARIIYGIGLVGVVSILRVVTRCSICWNLRLVEIFLQADLHSVLGKYH